MVLERLEIPFLAGNIEFLVRRKVNARYSFVII